jgi:hypothetical protein
MSDDPRLFLAASAAAEESLEFLSAAEGKQAEARLYLRCIDALAVSEFSTTLDDARDDLAGVAEGQICVQGHNGPLYYSSAHEAVHSLWLRVSILLSWYDVVTPDVLSRLQVPNTSSLRAYLLRERAKLLKQASAEPAGHPPEPDTQATEERDEAKGESEAPTGHPGAVSHSEDFRTVRWYGTDYTFTPTQAACVRVLYEAYSCGRPDVGQETILNRAGSEGARVRDLFKRPGGMHSAWGTMILRGPSKGLFRLANPKEIPAPR